MKAILAAAVLLSGCATATSGSSGGDGAMMCNANAAERFVGLPLKGNEEAAQRAAGAQVIRAYVTGDALTMDYRSDRLNIETDPNGKIVAVSCS
ncbi:I78 family peptidase inhibitor [Sphingomonas sp.]|jgi:hypothetical protein|uniref:I78 family peptidase inhibitor n=1 Tax=Sphingomonas sp. TaxID=28214 RepID=UPI002613253A|nr:I78 family peptidase inhibitor [Sphingomonas sp.]MDF2493363.1 lipoprotein [Sphingomonas sp.]